MGCSAWVDGWMDGWISRRNWHFSSILL
jgi:hypothetical protein